MAQISETMEVQNKNSETTIPATDRWKRLVPRILQDLSDEKIDIIPEKLPEIVAKIATGESNKGKGLCLYGTTGTGKTKRFEFISEKIGITILTANDIVEAMISDGENSVNDMCKLDVKRWNNVPPHFFDLIIDDLGAEPTEQVIYGTRHNIIADIIEKRYRVFPQWKTHISTNLTKKDMEERYEHRAFSRLNEMCVFFPMTGIDRRMS